MSEKLAIQTEYREFWNHRNMVQLMYPRIWVRWGYCEQGKTSNPMHVAPAMVCHSFVKGTFSRFPFQLPEKGWVSDGVTYVPKIYDRVKKWGWRLNNRAQPGGMPYYLADSREQCLADALAYFKSEGLIIDGLLVGKNITWPKGWRELQAEGEAAVRQWSEHKGWPKGWRGQ